MYINYQGGHIALRWQNLTPAEQREVLKRQRLRECIADGYMEAWEITGGFYVRQDGRVLYVDPVTMH